MNVKPGEKLMDLERNGLKAIQNLTGYCFSMGSVLLAVYAKARPSDRVADLCCGNGIILLLMSARYEGQCH